MRKALPFLLSAPLFLLNPVRSSFASSPTQADLEKEYVQVRKIALKDPRVQDAFAKANMRLEEKILQIDPALKPVIDRQARAAAPVARETPRAKIASQPFASTTPSRHEHIVIKGETLSSIGEHYHVKVATIEQANHITDDRKLRVGQKLIIPPAEALETQPAAESQPTPAKQSDGLWDRLKSNF